MSKLPQHIEERYNVELASKTYHIFDELNGRPEEFNLYYDVEQKIKSFIATILEEERERIIARFKDEWLGDDYHGEAIEKIIREMNIINLIREDEV